MMNTPSDKLLYQIALTRIHGVGDIIGRNLLQVVGNEEILFRSSRKSLLRINGVTARLVDEILKPEVLLAAEKELAFVEKNNIKTYFIGDENYPKRLRECSDAPLLLYYKGNADLNNQRIISIVGTRKSSVYGNSFCDSFLQELSQTIPNLLVVSGLAYGIDINVHRSALRHNLPTVGVLAHGLDRIYPSAHRNTAVEMIEQGGLLTDFPSDTEPDRFNFVKRNRIVAGIADAIIVVESGAKGGSLITAEIANSYCKDVFAVPGKTTDSHSIGCNRLIANHKADLLLSTEYFLEQMGWNSTQKKSKAPRQQSLFIDLNTEELSIINILTKYSSDGLHIDFLSKEAGIAAYELFSILLELEMKGIIKNLPGNMYTIC